MNITGLSQDPEALQAQFAQMAEQLNNTGPNDLPEVAKPKQVSSVAFEFDTMEIAEAFGLFVDSSPLGAGTPHLKAPSEQRMLEPSSGEKMALALEEAPASEPVKSVAGVEINSPELQSIAQFHPLAKMAILEMGEEKLLSELTSYFEGQGLPVPQNPEDPTFKKALFDIFNEKMQRSDSVFPQELTTQLQDSLILLGDAVDYLEYASGIAAPNISPADNPNVKMGIQMLTSMEEMIEGTIAELQKTGQPDGKGSMLEFMKHMMEMLREVRMTMLEAQMSETDKNHEKMLGKLEAIDMRTKKQMEEFHKQEKQLKLQENMEVFQDTLAILMPCMQILFVIVAVVFLPIAPLIILLSTIVTITLISVQIALTEEGVMESSFAKINTFAANLLSFIGDDDLAELIFWVIAIIAILVIAVALIMVPGVAAVVPAIAGTIIGWIVANSGIVDTIVRWLKDKTGWDDEWADAIFAAAAGMSISFLSNGVMMIAGLARQLVEELLKIVVELAIAIIELIVTLVFKILQMTISLIIKLVETLLNTGISVVTTLLKSAIKLLVKMIATVIKILVKIFVKIVMMIFKLAMKLIESGIKALITTILKTVLSVVKSLVQKILNAVLNAIASLIQQLVKLFLLEFILEIIKKVVETIVAVLHAVINFLKWMLTTVRSITELVFDLFKNGLVKLIQISSTAQQASYKMALAKLTESLGLLEAVIAQLDELIRIFSREIDASMGQTDSKGVGEFMEVINDLTKFIEKLLSGRSRIMGEIAAAVS